MAIQFADFTKEEEAAVKKIVERAHKMFRGAGLRRTKLDIRMDISAVHATTPLRLAELAEADDFNFNHDLGGIAHKLDRSTGELRDHFLPRFVKREG